MTETTTTTGTEAPAGHQCPCGEVHAPLSYKDCQAAMRAGKELVARIATGETSSQGSAQAAVEEVFSKGGETTLWACIGIADALSSECGLKLPEDDTSGDVRTFSTVFSEEKDEDFKPSESEEKAAGWASRFYRATSGDDPDEALRIFTEHAAMTAMERSECIWSLLGTAALSVRLREHSERQHRHGDQGIAALLAKLGLSGSTTPVGRGININVINVDSAGLSDAIEAILGSLAGRGSGKDQEEEDSRDAGSS